MKCRLCSDDSVSDCFSLGLQPLANKYPQDISEIEVEKRYSMDVSFCPNCRSLQMGKIISRQEMFEDYYYLSSVNKELVAHFEGLAATLAARQHEFVVDIGSNDGVLLKPLNQIGIKSLGIDPSVNVGAIANQQGLKTLIGYFDHTMIDKVIAENSQPTAIVASSVFTHLENPNQFLIDSKNLLREGGELIIEIEYLVTIIDELKFERLYFDRPNYYSLTTVIQMANEVGLVCHDVELIDPHGGSIRIYLSDPKHPNRYPTSADIKKILIAENDKLNKNYILNQFEAFKYECEVLKQSLVELNNSGQTIIGYGAPARLATITNFAGIDHQLISLVIDDSPLKVNRFSPGMHIPIKSFEDGTTPTPDIVLLFAYEYEASILEKLSGFSVTAFIPVPFKKVRSL